MDFNLRAWRTSDLESLLFYANNPQIASNMADTFLYPYTPEKGISFLEFAVSGKPQHVFAIDINGAACGGIGIHAQHDIMRKNMELGYWLGEPFWGNGILPKAIREVITYGFATFDVERIFARPFGSNLRSQRALEKAGFIFETKFEKTIFKDGRFEDELFYAIRRENLK